ncbi:Uncharacterised protein [Salmonella enterica subsp. enterica serovar Bovismorbificans]|uniref:Uncharacterized protein n=1 Tax=Salmonella enterica subsp. enterica serovar Bovismorbificans TaxID=58097 RepID=A0A655ECF6_SALET|nr:Uncharacterised protein [Salmonella enterica subsp. enterica serovar Bovismorbificans]
MTHPKDAFTGFTHHRERFRNQALYAFAFFNTGAKFVGFRFQFVIGEFFHLRFHRINKADGLTHTTQRTIVTATEYFG